MKLGCGTPNAAEMVPNLNASLRLMDCLMAVVFHAMISLVLAIQRNAV